jgi:phage antirepressor YoqD-like protein
LSSTAKLPQNYLQALEALVESEKEKLLLISENQQKQSIIEDFIIIDENKNYTEVAKLLHKKPREFINMLKNEKYTRLNREPYQKYIDSNHFVIKYKKGIRREEDGRCIEIEDKSFPAYLITPKGFEYFVKKLK